ncbi:hypothetical protein [Microbulbifer variabilis]|uniref:hypothetical protein n=1 Tax=Microbulbifer variabilis TaxID=266805 RepID=UPI001CFEF02D|nr:hypothetical protein [Microbulbifer variabilis]
MIIRGFFTVICLQILSFSLYADPLAISSQQQIQTDLKEVRLIAKLRGYAILAGRHCINCDENLAIYIRRIARPGETESTHQTDDEVDRYIYPGKYLDYMSKKLVEKTRMFYGHCYEGQPSLLWLTEYRSGDTWVQSEYLVLLGDEGLEHRYVEGQQPSVLQLESEHCKELPGALMEMEP